MISTSESLVNGGDLHLVQLRFIKKVGNSFISPKKFKIGNLVKCESETRS